MGRAYSLATHVQSKIQQGITDDTIERGPYEISPHEFAAGLENQEESWSQYLEQQPSPSNVFSPRRPLNALRALACNDIIEISKRSRLRRRPLTDQPGRDPGAATVPVVVVWTQ